MERQVVLAVEGGNFTVVEHHIIKGYVVDLTGEGIVGGAVGNPYPARKRSWNEYA